MTGASYQDNGSDGANARAEAWAIGKNVPWSVSWTGEMTFDLRPSEDFPGLMEVVQAERPGEGSPMFAAQHVSRHRRGIARHVCHVCGRRTPNGDRFIFPVQSGGFVDVGEARQRYAGNVPPVHMACAKRAQRLCPHLSHSYALPVAFPSEESRLLQRTDVPPGMEGLAKTMPAGLKVVYTCVRLYGPRFSKQVERLRRETLRP